MRPARKNFKEDVLAAIAAKEGISRRVLRTQMQCGEKQLRDVVNKLEEDGDIHIYHKLKGMCLYTLQYAIDNNTPTKEKRKTPVYGMNKARLEGKVVLSDSQKSSAAARIGQKIVNLHWIIPSRVSAT